MTILRSQYAEKRNEGGIYREAKTRKAKRKKEETGVVEWLSSLREVQRTLVAGFLNLLHVSSEASVHELSGPLSSATTAAS